MRTKPRENPEGKVVLAVAVESASVPVSGVEFTTWSATVSEERRSSTTVPRGILRPSITTSTGEALSMVTSGMVKLPVGVEGTGTPSTLTTLSAAGGVVGKTSWNGVAKNTDGLMLPVICRWRPSIRMRPLEA